MDFGKLELQGSPERNHAIVQSGHVHATWKSRFDVKFDYDFSYGQKFLTSWGYKFDLPDDHDELTAWGKDAAAAIKTIRGTKYGVGTASGGLYVAGTSSVHHKLL